MLRAAGAPFSAPKKQDVIRIRVSEALHDSKRIDLADVAALLREAEEHGRQHVFLYDCTKTKAGQLLDGGHVRRALKQIGALSALDSPRVLDVPDTATIVEIRLETFPKGQPKALIVKQVDRREVLLPPERKGDFQIRKYGYTRGVNVVRLHHDGLLEVRIQSDRKIDYADARDNLLTLLDPLLPKGDFLAVSLEKAKELMWKEKEERRNEYRLSWGKARNPGGGSVVFAPGRPSAHLEDEEGMKDAFNVFLTKGSAGCDAWVVTFNTRNEEQPRRDNDNDDDMSETEEEPEELRVVMLGEAHEFYLTAQCSAAQYEYVLRKLRAYNA